LSNSPDPSNFLRKALRGNGIFSLVTGVVMFAADGLVAALLGAYDHLDIIHFVGANLLVFAALLFFVASREAIPSNLVVAIIIADALWVLLSAIALATGMASGQGFWAVGLVSDVVLLFAILQGVGLRRSQRALAST
jgi:uncharacterized membrane protein (UPF0136 family)